ncbi:MAG: DUF4235 domain-containing protein [Candidatus Nanopelagicales bacterium]
MSDLLGSGDITPAAGTDLPTPVEEPTMSPLMHVVAPLAAIAGVWLARKVLNTMYETTTGRKPPQADDPSTNVVRAILWSAATAATAAAVEVAIFRAASRRVAPKA